MPSMTSTGIAYDDQGSGDVTLLFLPGWCGPRTLFQPLAQRLTRCRTLAVDWRGHGNSRAALGEFGNAELLADALAVIAESGATTVVPVTVAHGGWIGIELRRRLGADRVPKLTFLDWMVLGAPAPFLDALHDMADPATTRRVVDHVREMWLAGLDIPELLAYVDSMARFRDDMWARAAREISAAFAADPVPLEALAALDDPPATLHLYAQPAAPAFHAAQHAFAADHPWFRVEQLDAASHFPMFEIPGVMADRLQRFVDEPAWTAAATR